MTSHFSFFSVVKTTQILSRQSQPTHKKCRSPYYMIKIKTDSWVVLLQCSVTRTGETSGWQNSPLSRGNKALLRSSLLLLPLFLSKLITLREFLSLRVVKQKFEVQSKYGLYVSSAWIELTSEITNSRISKSRLSQNKKIQNLTKTGF